jgi:hypothetical protein
VQRSRCRLWVDTIDAYEKALRRTPLRSSRCYSASSLVDLVRLGHDVRQFAAGRNAELGI